MHFFESLKASAGGENKKSLSSENIFPDQLKVMFS